MDEKVNEEQQAEVQAHFETECADYAENKKQIEDFNKRLSEATKSIDEQIRQLNEEKKEIFKQFEGEGETLNVEGGTLKILILEGFPKDEKTVKFEGIGRFTKKIQKGIEVVDKDKLLAALIKKDMLSKGVKSFDTTFLKKAIELKLFSENEVKGTEKPLLQFTEEKVEDNQKV